MRDFHVYNTENHYIMKKLFGILTMILIISVSCKKEEPIISDSIIGNWSSVAVNLGGNNVYFKAEFNSSGKYLLTLLDAQNDEVLMTLDEASYTVNIDESKITVEEPDFNQQASGDPIMVTYYVIISKDKTEMRWFPSMDNGENPTLVWTRE